MFDLEALGFLIVLFAFAMGGLAKGVFGLGMPFVALPIMVIAVPYQTAVALFLIPNITANLFQAIQRGAWSKNLFSYISLWLPMICVIPFSVKLLVQISQETGCLILGVISILFVISQLISSRVVLMPSSRVYLNPIVGIFAGFLGGLSGLYGPILIVYFLALQIKKDDFVSVLSLMYLLGSVPLYGGLALESFITIEVVLLSALGAFIIWLMMIIGQKLRDNLDEKKYRQYILIFIFLIGLDLLRRSFF